MADQCIVVEQHRILQGDDSRPSVQDTVGAADPLRLKDPRFPVSGAKSNEAKGISQVFYVVAPNHAVLDYHRQHVQPGIYRLHVAIDEETSATSRYVVVEDQPFLR